MVLIPTVLWAQRKASVYITIDLQDAKDAKVDVNNSDDGKYGKLHFTATGAGGDYELSLNLFAPVDADASKISITPRHTVLVLQKKEEETWPRLTQEPSKQISHVKVDWDKWVDSDDEGEGGDDAFGGMDFSSLGGMGGMGGMPGMGGMGGLAGMMGGMGGMGGLGGMGGMNFDGLGALGGEDDEEGANGGGGAAAAGEDSDDEDLPELTE